MAAPADAAGADAAPSARPSALLSKSLFVATTFLGGFAWGLQRVRQQMRASLHADDVAVSGGEWPWSARASLHPRHALVVCRGELAVIYST